MGLAKICCDDVQRVLAHSVVHVQVCAGMAGSIAQLVSVFEKQGGVALYGPIVNMPERCFVERYPLFAGWAAGGN